jgi:hypothetical protein
MPIAEPHTAATRGAANRRTAIVLASIAVVFFGGVIAAQYFGTPTTSMAVLGAAILGYLVVSIGRNFRR